MYQQTELQNDQVYLTMNGGGPFGDFVNWVRGLFGSSVEKYIADNKIDPTNLVKAQGVLSQKMLDELNELLNMNMSKKGSVAKSFVDQMVDNDQTIASDEKTALKKTFTTFVDNGKNILTGNGRSKLMKSYQKNIDVISAQLDLLGVDAEEKEKMLVFYKNQVISKYTMYQLTVEYIYLIKTYISMDQEFKNAVDKMKKDTIELINTIVEVTGQSTKTLGYQSSLPRMISGVVLSKLLGDEKLSPKQNKFMEKLNDEEFVLQPDGPQQIFNFQGFNKISKILKQFRFKIFKKKTFEDAQQKIENDNDPKTQLVQMIALVPGVTPQKSLQLVEQMERTVVTDENGNQRQLIIFVPVSQQEQQELLTTGTLPKNITQKKSYKMIIQLGQVKKFLMSKLQGYGKWVFYMIYDFIFGTRHSKNAQEADQLLASTPMNTVELFSVLAGSDAMLDDDELTYDIMSASQNKQIINLDDVKQLTDIVSNKQNDQVQQSNAYKSAMNAIQTVKGEPTITLEQQQQQLTMLFKAVNTQDDVIDAIVKSVIRIDSTGIVLQRSRVIEKLELYLSQFNNNTVQQPQNYVSLLNFLDSMKNGNIKSVQMINSVQKQSQSDGSFAVQQLPSKNISFQVGQQMDPVDTLQFVQNVKQNSPVQPVSQSLQNSLNFMKLLPQSPMSQLVVQMQKSQGQNSDNIQQKQTNITVAQSIFVQQPQQKKTSQNLVIS